MCAPPLIVYAAVVAAAKMYEGAQQGKADYAVAKYNAAQMENQAQRVANKGVEDENKLRQKAAETMSAQRAQLAAGGVDVNAGSALEIQEDTAIGAEADAMTLRGNVQQEVSALNQQAESTLVMGRHARKMGALRGFTGGVSSGLQVYSAGGGFNS